MAPITRIPFVCGASPTGRGLVTGALGVVHLPADLMPQAAEVSPTTEIVEASPKRGFAAQFRWKDNLLFLALALPNVALLIAFTYRPLLDNVRLSFTDWTLLSNSPAQWIGLKNYVDWLHDPGTPRVVFNTVVFTGAAVVISMVVGLAVALLLDQQLVGRNLVRSAMFAPFVISGAAIGVAFNFVFDPNFGIMPPLLKIVGVATIPDMTQSPSFALFALTFTYIWKNLGYTFVIYLAALQGTNKDLDEAAAIDGASWWTRFTKVTLPQLRPATYFLSVTVLLNTLNVFDLINTLLPGGGPENGGTTMVYSVFQQFYLNQRAGYGAAIATIMFVVLLFITVIQVRMMDRGDRA